MPKRKVVHFSKKKGLAKRYKFSCGVKKGFYTFRPSKVTCKRCKKVLRAEYRKVLKAKKRKKCH